MVVLFIYHRGEACLLRGSLSPKKIYFLRGGDGCTQALTHTEEGKST